MLLWPGTIQPTIPSFSLALADWLAYDVYQALVVVNYTAEYGKVQSNTSPDWL